MKCFVRRFVGIVNCSPASQWITTSMLLNVEGEGVKWALHGPTIKDQHGRISIGFELIEP